MNKSSYIIEEALMLLEQQVSEATLTDQMSAPDEVISYLKLKLAKKRKEEFGVILLSNSNNVIRLIKLASGTENRCHIYIKEAIRKILRSHATGVIFYHNHPSGNKSFSSQDIDLTKKFKTVLDLLEIRTLDHVLISRSHDFSMRHTRPEVF